MWHGEPKKVTLTRDLTRCHEHLKHGARGTTIPNAKVGLTGYQDRSWAVRFDCCGHVRDILSDSLEVDGEAEDVERWWQEFRDHCHTTTEAIRTFGPQGGFRYLVVKFVNSAGKLEERMFSWEEGAEEATAILASKGIGYQDLRLPRARPTKNPWAF